jgi:hypothetical protein
MNADLRPLMCADLKSPFQICGYLQCGASAAISGQLAV